MLHSQLLSVAFKRGIGLESRVLKWVMGISKFWHISFHHQSQHEFSRLPNTIPDTVRGTLHCCSIAPATKTKPFNSLSTSFSLDAILSKAEIGKVSMYITNYICWKSILWLFLERKKLCLLSHPTKSRLTPDLRITQLSMILIFSTNTKSNFSQTFSHNTLQHTTPCSMLNKDYLEVFWSKLELKFDLWSSNLVNMINQSTGKGSKICA